MKISIAFDLDGVLIDLMTPIKAKIFEMYGVEYDENDPECCTYNLTHWMDLTSKELWIAFREAYKDINTVPIYPGATELLAKLYERTNEPPMILTARPFDTADLAYKVVKKIAKKTPFSLILKHPLAHKSQYLKGYSVYVEDRRRTAIELSDLGFAVPLVRTHYNKIEDIKNHPGIFYINGVHELIPDIDYFTSV